MQQRFPDVDWFCDNCDAHLNKQKNFDDRKYIWKCTKCGYKSSLSYANIRYKDPVFFTIIGFLLGVARSFSLLTIVVFSAALLQKIDLSQSQSEWLFKAVIGYLVLFVISLFFERGIAKYGIHKKFIPWAICSIPVYILGDIFRPLKEILGYPVAVLKGRHYVKKGFQAKKTVYAVAYLLIIIYVCIMLGQFGLLALGWEQIKEIVSVYKI